MFHNNLKMRKCISGLLIAALVICGVLSLEPDCIYAAETSDKVIGVCVGGDHSSAIKVDGSLWVWGVNPFIEQNIGNTINSPIPLKIMNDVKSVNIASRMGAAIKTDGSLWVWGDHACGEQSRSTTPIKIMENVIAASIGGNHCAAIKTDHSLWMWGGNIGEIAGTEDPWIPNPIKVMDNVKAVSLGDYYSAAIKTDDSLWLWGKNEYGQLGNGNTTDSRTPIKIMDDVKAVSLGYRHSAAIKKDGSLWTWGENWNGQLGNGEQESFTISNTPIKVMEGVKAISLGGCESAAIKTDGSLWLWGWNDSGQLGNGIIKSSMVSTPIKVMEGVEAVSIGVYHCAAIKTDGSLWLWGRNEYSQIGDGTTDRSEYPKRIYLGQKDNDNPSTPSNSSGSNIGNTGKRVSSVQSSVKNTLFVVKLTKVSKGKKSFTAKWKKASKKQQKKFSGYQIQYSTRPDFLGWVKTKSTKNKKVSKVVIRKLKPKTNYYVRIRRFRKSGGTVIYSNWSNVKQVKTK